jgi:hypothetical protein
MPARRGNEPTSRPPDRPLASRFGECDDPSVTDEGRPRRRPIQTSGRLVPALLLVALVAGCRGFSTGGTESHEDVRGTFADAFMWAVADPTLPIEPIDAPAAAELVDRAARSIDEQRDATFGISIVTTFSTPEEANAQAAIVREILATSARWYADPAHRDALAELNDPERSAQFTPPEVAGIEAHLLAAGERGVGWGGDAGEVDDAVYAIGPVLVITGLKSETQSQIDFPPLHPLAHLLAAAGGDVLVEGDRFGEGSIVADVSCRLDDAAEGGQLIDDVGDAILTGGQYSTRPPWMGPSLTDSERLARATIRRWWKGASAAMQDAQVREYANRLIDANAEDRARITEEFGAYIAKRGVELIDGPVDPEVLALLLESANTDTTAAKGEEAKQELATRLGSLPVTKTEYGDHPAPDDYARLAITGSVRIHSGRLEIGWLAFGRMAAGLPSLAGYLTAHGCTDLRVGLVDFDAVRGD